MDRPPPPPFQFPNNNNNSSSFSHNFPLFDPANSHHLNFQSPYSSNNNNFSSPLPPFTILQQRMETAAYYQSFAAAQLPTNWTINDPSAVGVSFYPQTYVYPHYHYYYYSTQQQQQIHNAASDNTTNYTSSSLELTLQLLPSPDQNHQNIPDVVDHQGINASDTSTVNKKLKFVFKKELKSSDVSPLGRIVIPKKDAEQNLPPLISREGISLVVSDLYSDRQWNLKFKFWSNKYTNRMYVLENTEDFVKNNRLKKGDLIIFYLDEESHNYFFSIKRVEEIKREKHFAEEEDVDIEAIIENLRHSDEQEEEDNNLLTMGIQAGGSYNSTYTAASSSSSCHQPGINNFFPFL